MRISSRRLRWGAVLLLTLLCGVLIRPARSWVDQRVIGRLLDPRLEAGQVHFHASGSLLEIQQPSWRSGPGEQELEVSAERAWFALDAERLLDKHFIAPKVVLEAARLQLKDSSPRARPVSNVWQAALSQRVRELDWHDVGQRFRRVLATDELTPTWRERMQRWSSHSADMLRAAEEMELDDPSLKNPLRWEAEQQVKIEQLAKLAQEQLVVKEKFASLHQLVDAKSRRVEERLALELEKIDDQLQQQVGDPELVARIARDMVRSSALTAWNRVADYARLGDCLSRATWGSLPEMTYGNVRSSSTPVLDLREIVAEGFFTHARLRTPFQLTGRYQRLPGAPLRCQNDSVWQLRFNPAERPLILIVSNRRAAAATTDLQLASPIAGVGGESKPCPRLVLAAQGERLSGEFLLQPEELQPEDWPDGYDPQVVQPIPLHVAGTWEQIEFEVVDELPPWLLAMTQRTIERELLSSRGELASQLQSLQESHLAQFAEVATAAREGMARTTGQGELIAEQLAQRRLHSERIQREREFARRPASTLR